MIRVLGAHFFADDYDLSEIEATYLMWCTSTAVFGGEGCEYVL